MLTRLEVDGFKSLQGFAVDLEPLTVFIGPNGAGKSNILEALALLSRLATMPIIDAFKLGRGSVREQFSRHGSELAREMRFAVEFLFFGECSKELVCSPSRFSRFRYELVIVRETRPSGTEHLLVEHELLVNLRAEDDAWVRARPDFAALVNPEYLIRRWLVADSEQAVRFPDIEDARVELPTDRRSTALARSHGSRAGLDNYVPANFDASAWLRLDLHHLADASERADGDWLQPDGSNLPTVLADLPPTTLGQIRADLVALVPGLSSFAIVSDNDELAIEFELSGGERLPARLISDGTLRLLGLLTALRLDPRPFLIGIEEPETGIYPGRLRALAELLQHEANRRLHEDAEHLAGLFEPAIHGMEGITTNLLPTQILLTTHSPVFLAALRQQQQCLRFVDTVHRDHRRVTRARTVGRSTPAQRQLVISTREIDELMHSATGGDAE